MYKIPKISRKDIEGATILMSHGGNESSLSAFFDKIGYNAGLYGWNWDAFEAGNVVVVTGYRSFPRIDYSIDYDAERKILNAYHKREITQKQARAKYLALIKRTMNKKTTRK